MNILVLPPRYTVDTIAMSRAAARLGWRVERLSSWRVPSELCGAGPAIYGEPLFVTVVAGPLGTNVLEPSPAWLPELPTEYRRRWVRLMTLGEARQTTSSAFIKPVADKCFVARVYAAGSELPPTCDLDDSELVLIAEPVVWQIEFRAFVLDRRVMTMSPYERGGELVEDPEGRWTANPEDIAAAEEYCQSFLADTRAAVPPAFVLDVGMIASRGWAVVEANPAWGSGLYGCDPESALGVVNRACVTAGSEQADDRPWIRAG